MSSFNEDAPNNDSIAKAGYKHTDVGMIPSDWEVKKLREISPSQSVGLVINPSSYYDDRGSIPMLVGSHVEENKITWESANRITKESNAKLPASRLYSGDLVTVRVGAPGITAVIPQELDQANCASMMIIRQGEKFDSNWLCFMMNSFIGRTRIEGVQYGTAQKQFNIIDAIDFLFPFPKKTEQTAIANALSDVDALIQELEKLIAKKQAIKTATMQQLLTGRTRLPQFAHHPDGRKKGYKPSELGEIPEDWETVQLDDCSAYVGSGKTNTKSTGDFPLYGSTGLIGSCARPEYLGEALLVARVGANAGRLNYVSGEYGVSDNTIIIKLKSDNNIAFFKYWLIRKNLNTLVFGSGQPLITGTQLKDLALPLPSKKEQTPIAMILSDMDEEIQALEQRLSKTRQIKQGMMQELLTGKTRLL